VSHGLHDPYLRLLLSAAVSAGLLPFAVSVPEPMDYGRQLFLLRVVATVVRLPDDVHDGDGFHLGQGHHAPGRHARATAAGGHRLRGDEPELSGLFQVLHVRRPDPQPIARGRWHGAVSGAARGVADWYFVLYVPFPDLHRGSLPRPCEPGEIVHRFLGLRGAVSRPGGGADHPLQDPGGTTGLAGADGETLCFGHLHLHPGVCQEDPAGQPCGGRGGCRVQRRPPARPGCLGGGAGLRLPNLL